MKRFALLVLACGSYKLTVESNSLTLRDSDGWTLQLPKSTTGDCLGRRNCYQSGQFMVNLPKHSLPTRAWVNTDVDDNTEHHSLGEMFRCKAVIQ